ncbi:hypothetical protein HDV00_012237 [Rhizophlyctis rosea]|nr:hypothetical protein HDV00_012237 [Rhizophlyctis rosea]
MNGVRRGNAPMPPGVFQANPAPKPIMPKMTPAPKLSKADKFAVDFFRTEKRLALEDEHQEAILRDSGGMVPPSLGMAVRSVNVVNMPGQQQVRTTGANMAAGGTNGSPPPTDHFPRNPPPPRRGGGGGSDTPPPPYTPRRPPRGGGGGGRFHPYGGGGGMPGSFPKSPSVIPPTGGPSIATMHPLTGGLTITDTGNVSNTAEAITSPPSVVVKKEEDLPEMVPNPVTTLHPPVHSSAGQLAVNEINYPIKHSPVSPFAREAERESRALGQSIKANLIAPTVRGRTNVGYHIGVHQRDAKLQAAGDASAMYNAIPRPRVTVPIPAVPNPIANIPQVVQRPSNQPLMTSVSGMGGPSVKVEVDEVVTPVTSNKRKRQGESSAKRAKGNLLGGDKATGISNKVYQNIRKDYNQTVGALRKKSGLAGTGVTTMDAPAYKDGVNNALGSPVIPQPIPWKPAVKRKDEGFPGPGGKRVRFNEPVAPVEIPVSKKAKGKGKARAIPANANEYDPTSLVGSSGGGPSGTQRLPELTAGPRAPLGTFDAVEIVVKAKGKGKATKVAQKPLGKIPIRNKPPMKGKAPKATNLPRLNALQVEPIASRTRAKQKANAPVASRTRSKKK